MSEIKPFYALYVEKEMVGKRIQNTKVKVTWKFACGEKLLTQEIQLKHSLISGKREIRLNGNVVFCSKKSSDKSQPFRKTLAVLNTTATVHVEDGSNGYVYDLLLDGMPFHKTNRISVTDLEKLRKERKERKKRVSTHRLSYNEFVRKESANASPGASSEDLLKKEPSAPEEDLLGDLTSSTVPVGYGATAFPSTGNPTANPQDLWGALDSTTTPAQHQTSAGWNTTPNTSDFNPFDQQPSAPLGNTNGYQTQPASQAQPVQDFSFASTHTGVQPPPFAAQHSQYQPHGASGPGYGVHAPTPTPQSIAEQLQSLDFGSAAASHQPQQVGQQSFNGNGAAAAYGGQGLNDPFPVHQAKHSANATQGSGEFTNLVDLSNLSTGQGKHND